MSEGGSSRLIEGDRPLNRRPVDGGSTVFSKEKIPPSFSIVAIIFMQKTILLSFSLITCNLSKAIKEYALFLEAFSSYKLNPTKCLATDEKVLK